MKLNHHNTKLIDEYISKHNFPISFGIDNLLFLYKELFAKEKQNYYGTSLTNRSRSIRDTCEFIARDLLKILYTRNEKSAKGIATGFVYAITNPAWPDYVKVGSAIDVYDRLSSYQTSSPKRDYCLRRYIFVEDRLEFEKLIHSKYPCDGEWVKSAYVLIEFDILKDKFLAQIKEFCVLEMMEEFSKATKALLLSTDKRKLSCMWRETKHVLGYKLEKEHIEKISKYVETNKAWSFISRDHSNVVYCCKRFNLRGTISSDAVKLEFYK